MSPYIQIFIYIHIYIYTWTGVVWPEKLRKYMDYFAAAGDVPMYDSMAC
jgi:glutaredoxin 2